MNKRIRKVFLGVMILMLITGGCGKRNAASEQNGKKAKNITVEEEIVRFVNVDLPSISGERDRAIDSMNSYFSGAGVTDTTEDLNKLEQDSLKVYDQYMDELKAIEVQKKEVQELKQIYVESSALQREAMEDMLQALENSDDSLVTEAKERLEESEAKMDQYEETLTELCEKYDIRMNGSFSGQTENSSQN